MKRLQSAMLAIVFGIGMTGCAYLGGGTNLAQVASNADLKNVTTGDGTFENYTATGHHSGTEVGIGIGIPMLVKLAEIYPAASNEQLLTDVAKAAKSDGATDMINTTPHKEIYTGFPFFLIGIYVDGADGTGIKPKR